MRDVQSSVHGSLHGSEDARPGGGAGESDVQVAAEGARLPVRVLHVVRVSVHLLLTLVDVAQAQLVQQLRRKCNFPSHTVSRTRTHKLTELVSCTSEVP